MGRMCLQPEQGIILQMRSCCHIPPSLIHVGTIGTVMLQAAEAEEAVEEEEAPRRTRRQKQAAANTAEQEQQPARSTRSRAKQQQQQHDMPDGADPADQQQQQLKAADFEQQQQDGQQDEEDMLDDFKHDAELASSVQGLLQQSDPEDAIKILRPNPDLSEATRRAAKVCCHILVWVCVWVQEQHQGGQYRAQAHQAAALPAYIRLSHWSE